MKKWMLGAGFLGLLVFFACDSNSPAGPAGNLNPPGPNPSPTYWGTIFEIENGGARFKLAAHTGEILNVRTDKNTQIYREESDSLFSPADLREGDKAEIDGIYQGSPKETAIRAGYIYIYATP